VPHYGHTGRYHFSTEHLDQLEDLMPAGTDHYREAVHGLRLRVLRVDVITDRAVGGQTK
jgi:hypothetical protein